MLSEEQIAQFERCAERGTMCAAIGALMELPALISDWREMKAEIYRLIGMIERLDPDGDLTVSCATCGRVFAMDDAYYWGCDGAPGYWMDDDAVCPECEEKEQ